MKLLQRKLADFLNSGHSFAMSDALLKYRYSFLNLLLSLFLFLGAILALLNLERGTLALADVAILFFLFSFVSLLVLRIPGTLPLVSQLVNLVVFAYIVFTVAHLRKESSLFWCFFFPLVVFSLSSPRLALFWILLFVGAIVVAIGTLFPAHALERDFLVRFFITFFLISSVLYLLSSTIEVSQRVLSSQNRQLNDLNVRLEQRVAEETEKGREKERILFQQSRLAFMGEMLNAIAHQWRQPLNVLGLLIQELEELEEAGALDKEVVSRLVGESMEKINHLSGTIDDFRNFFRQDRQKRAFDLYQAVVDACRLLQKQMEGNGIQLRIQCWCENRKCSPAGVAEREERCPEGTFLVQGFPNEFKQALLNLLANAQDSILSCRSRMETLPGLVQVTLKSSAEAEEILLEVEDNGEGIPPENLDRIFEPYFSTRGESGTGIGLYMTRSLLLNIDATIHARRSETGAKFEIRLPYHGIHSSGEEPSPA